MNEDFLELVSHISTCCFHVVVIYLLLNNYVVIAKGKK